MADDQFHFFNHSNTFCILSKMCLVSVYFSNLVALYPSWPLLTSRLARSPLRCSFSPTYLTHYIVGPCTSCFGPSLLANNTPSSWTCPFTCYYILLDPLTLDSRVTSLVGLFFVYMLLHNKMLLCSARGGHLALILWLGLPWRYWFAIVSLRSQLGWIRPPASNSR